MNTYTFFVTHRVEIFSTTLEHVELVLIAVVIAVAVATPLGIFIVQRPALRTVVLGVASVFQTIPSLALFGFLALRLGDEEGAATHVLCFVKLVFCQWFRSADDESKFHCNVPRLPLKTPWDYFI